MKHLYVLCYVRTIDLDEPVIVKYGPTSESPALLASYDGHWPSRADTSVVVPVIGNGLLQVSRKALREALGTLEV